MERRTAEGLHGVLCLLLLYCCSTCATAVEEAYSEEAFPNPGITQDRAACGLTNNTYTYICDPSKSLTESDLNRLNTNIRSLRSVESCLCDKDGPCDKEHIHTIKVAIVPRIKYAGGFPENSEDEIKAVKSFAEHLRDKKWQSYDGRGCSLLAIIVLDLHTKRIWTATNYFAKKVITDERAEKVGLHSKDNYFKRELIYSGLNYMISNYKQFLEDGLPGLAWWVILLIVLGSIGGLGLLCCCCCMCAKNGGGGHGGGVWGGHGGSGGGGGCGGGGGGCGGGGGGCGGGGGG